MSGVKRCEFAPRRRHKDAQQVSELAPLEAAGEAAGAVTMPTEKIVADRLRVGTTPDCQQFVLVLSPPGRGRVF